MSKADIIVPCADSRDKEYVMLERLLNNVKTFYQNPDNIRAFENWKKNKEEHTDVTNYDNF